MTESEDRAILKQNSQKNAGQARKISFAFFVFIHRDTKISSGQRGLTFFEILVHPNINALHQLQ